ncbi:uroporphyrinogen decarboxylase family protein [Desulfitobacterium chlororespirans]|uniref:Uroporphyrinogen decarboxylase (URO-D) n=1 Tax=Desulfitobacterium chlororespirans DSM 11544 TaxID=1121395 RepID=A0A1M7SPG5_9FIRM|nr:uroporphyrinogen decarboxylase family protein [Desulfitobacterium chlororespirans]SHN60413.1 Uroporphyrinogen decarboxylase (URO-D) [Desulfitobacterium chlororespirans DSM 11544]
MNKSPEQLYGERLKRVNDAIQLKVPDRVPLIPIFQAFPFYHYGVTLEEAMNDYTKAAEAHDKLYTDFDPDLAWDNVLLYPAKVMELLDLKWFRWPGHGVRSNSMYQFLEGEYMKANEYEELISDPTNFIMSKWIPRSFGALEAFSNLSSMRDSLWLGWFSSFYPFSLPEVQKSLNTLMQASEELARWFGSIFEYRQKLKEKGFPAAWGAFAFAPFDMVADTLRGTVPALMDMRKHPEELLRAVEAMVPIAIESGINSAKTMGNPFVWIWLHKGVDDFMSDEQYKTFYWPSLRKLLMGLIDAGLTPMVYGEGSMNTRLEVLRDVPKGKVLYHFEHVDMFRAKEILGDVACISGNVPNSLLYFGTPQEVKDYCKKLIDVCGKDGGFMMDSGALIDEAKPENVKAMFEFTKEYGVYR